jgi:putative tryptophan/tyrosine transport system substrate-binding protein
MRRREFLGLAGALAAMRPAGAASPESGVRLIGFLSGASEKDQVSQAHFSAFRDALRELGWTEGRNLRIEVRWAGGDLNRLHTDAAELVKLAPSVILSHGTSAIATLKAATRSIPIVFVMVNDPVAQGYIPRIGHPGGNITGFSFMDYSMIGKALDLLKQMAPAVTRVGFLFDPQDYPYYEQYLTSLQPLRKTLSIEIVPLRVHSDPEIEVAVAEISASPGVAIIAPPSTFTLVHRKTIIDQTSRRRLPVIMPARESVAEGGLMSYAPNQTEIFKRAAPYVDRVLKGENPGDLPVQAPTKFEFVINLKTANTLGLRISPAVLAIADEVIE